jgi:hypothetical protein
MQSFIGWTIIVAVFCSVSALLLWPAFRLIRWWRPNIRGMRYAYAAAIAGFSFALWHLIPWGVYEMFGRAVH